MLTVITGAAGFVGSALAGRLAEIGYAGRVRLVDLGRPEVLPTGFEAVEADLTDPRDAAAALAGAERVIHLAALPGGAAESDPIQSRRINVSATLNVIEALTSAREGARLVYASSIAVFGEPLPHAIDDHTTPVPTMTYGAHKLICEAALVDATRRGALQGVALRLPGIVARPRQPAGLKSAFLSDLFWAIAAGEPLTVPVNPGATTWLMSVQCCAENIAHGLECALPDWRKRTITLPALRVTIAELITAIEQVSGGDATGIVFEPEESLEAQFGRWPPLCTALADNLGFRHDAGIKQLVTSAFVGARLSETA